jgi:hypothetical protein
VGSESEPPTRIPALGDLLSRLERVAVNDPPLRLVGLSVPAPVGRLRIAFSDKVFEFDAEEVVSAGLADNECGPTGAIEIELRPGARLRGIEPIAPYRDLLCGRRPFALASRPDHPTLSPGDAYHAAAQRYLARRGLAEHP